ARGFAAGTAVAEGARTPGGLMKAIIRTVIVPLALCAAGCLAAPPVDDEVDHALAPSGLTRARLTHQDPWVVSISAGGKGCTGNVLSSHWILTAAHCASVAQSSVLDVATFELPSALRHVYHGSAQYFPNPSWDPTCPLGQCIDTDADDDIGLIHLTG